MQAILLRQSIWVREDSGLEFPPATARLDVAADGFWGSPFARALFDAKAPYYSCSSLPAIVPMHDGRKYLRAARTLLCYVFVSLSLPDFKSNSGRRYIIIKVFIYHVAS